MEHILFLSVIIIMPRKNKQNATGDDNAQGTAQSQANKKQKPDWDHFPAARLRAEPKQFINIPKKLRGQTEYASAALLGLTSPRLDKRSKYQADTIVENIAKFCPTVLADANLAREFLVAANDEIIHQTITEKLISHIPWNVDLALLAIGKSPFFYKHLPEELKKDNEDLAFATLYSKKIPSTKDGEHHLNEIVNHLRSSCSGLFSNSAATNRLLHGKEDKGFVMTVLAGFCDKIVWDKDLAAVALERFPAVRSFLPAIFREDNLDAQHVMGLLLHATNKTNVEDVISAFPLFFADAAALKQVFLCAKTWITAEIVANMSAKLPWNKELIRLAGERCHDGEYHNGDDEEPNMADEEIERLYKGNQGCKHHLPLGMLLSYYIAHKRKVWPNFLNRCRCALVQDDSVLLTVLDFMKPMLLKTELAPKLRDWLQGLVDPIKMNFQNKQSFQTLLKCITVAGRDGQGPLDLFPRDVATSIALKQNISEFLLGSPVKAAETRQDALQVVYCLLTLPSEFVDEMGAPIDVLGYQSPYRDEDTFYCEWCCDALAELDEKYNGNHNTRKSASVFHNDEDNNEE